MRKENNVFWMNFRIWVQRRIEDGAIKYFTLRRLFKIFKDEYIIKYAKEEDGKWVAYYKLITFNDVFYDLYHRVIVPLLKAGVIEKDGRKKYRPSERVKMHRHPPGGDEKKAIHEVNYNEVSMHG